MQAARQVGNGLLYAMISIILVVGGLSLALAEGNNNSLSPTLTPSPTAVSQTLTTLSLSSTSLASTSLASTSLAFTSLASTPLVQVVVTATPIIIQSSTQTISALVNCIPPSGWILITVQPGESFSSLAERYQISPEQLEQANCLSAQGLPAGYNIYVPPPPISTTMPCGPFPGWIRGYVVQQGDTLYHIAVLYRVSLSNMERANCKSYSDIIFAGERLWVPNVPMITPGVTYIPIFDTPTEFPTEPLTLTPLPFTASPLPTSTSGPSSTTTSP